MPIDLNFTLTFEDYLHAQQLHARHNRWVGLNYFAARFILPVLGVCLIAIALFALIRGVLSAISFFNLGLGVFFVLYPWYYRLCLKRRFLRTRTGSEMQIEINEETIQVKTENSSSEVKWKAVKSYLEDGKLFLLYLAPAKFIALPKRVFSPEQIAALQALLAQKLAENHADPA